MAPKGLSMLAVAKNDTSLQISSIVDRWFLQSVARDILLDSSLGPVCHSKLPRVVHCNRTLTGGWLWNEAVHVDRKGHGENTQFGYSGVQTCGSWSACPICASKIANKRKKEILKAVTEWDKGSVLMLTLTAPHFKGESLGHVRERFMKARRLFRQQKNLKRDPQFQAFKSLRSKFSIAGSISSLEVTYSEANGWHFHSHELLFSTQDLDSVKILTLETLCKLAWLRACERAPIAIKDRFSFMQRGCKITLTDRKASDYLAKFGSWTAADELSKSHVKKGKAGSMTPWDFLRESSSCKDQYFKYGRLFLEVAGAFFGKQQIFFEKGFKKKLGITEMSDQEIAESEFEVGESEVYGVLSYFAWRQVCKLKLRGEILARCVSGESWPQIMTFLRSSYA